MANSYQRASSRRKLIYFGVILGLFVATIFVRGAVARPKDGWKEWPGKWAIQEQSERLEFTETSQGDVELTGSAIRLLLTGSRGIVICGLWISAADKQKRQEWSEMEQLVKSITKLQPHFIVPWLFQSWNLTYNVSVKMNGLNDMYFYISRGISLLADGEALNRNNPEMRHSIGFYYQNKFTVSDKVTTLRCLYQLSCIPKDERDYRKLLKGGQVDLEAFKAFCEKYPQLVRRLRETGTNQGKNFLASTPQGVVDFLRENETLPNRYRDDDPRMLEDRLKQFPVLPPPFYRTNEEEVNPDRSILDGEATALLASRVWYRYANEALPDPNPELEDRPIQKGHKFNKNMLTIIFRQHMPRAQTFFADQLAKDGWFDRDPWIVDRGRDPTGEDRWFKEPVQINPTSNAQEQWQLAYDQWSQHGRENGLNRSESNLNELKNRAEIFARKMGHRVADVNIPAPRPDEMERYFDSFKANLIIKNYSDSIRVTNFLTFLYQAEVEKDDITIRNRKRLYEADRERRRGNSKEAIAIYAEVFGTQQKIGPWGNVLQRYRSHNATDKIAEETYETEINYLRLLLNRDNAELRRATLAIFDIMSACNPAKNIVPQYFMMGEASRQLQQINTNELDNLMPVVPYFGIVKEALQRGLERQIKEFDVPAFSQIEPLWPPGPFDGVDSANELWIPELIKQRVRGSLGLIKPPASPRPSGPPTAQALPQG